MVDQLIGGGPVVYRAKGGPFLKSGDSGSLLVTDDNVNTPVGLVFAGNSSGKYGIANQIGDVLTLLGVAIDGAELAKALYRVGILPARTTRIRTTATSRSAVAGTRTDSICHPSA